MERGRITFRTVRGSDGRSGPAVAEHVFTSGVPSPGIESVRMNLYFFRGAKSGLQNGAEVVIERFEYLPERIRGSSRVWRSLAGLALACLIPRRRRSIRIVHSINTSGPVERSTGFPRRSRQCYCSNPDGYLWIGAEKGLVRLMGQSFSPVQSCQYQSVPGVVPDERAGHRLESRAMRSRHVRSVLGKTFSKIPPRRRSQSPGLCSRSTNCLQRLESGRERDSPGTDWYWHD